ncbi:hypothetical protein BAE44_0019461 [Dichanthelium oligosanthes]|uniref:Protein kinase domain-containing protein n=1 Tax=Dichanthelium oligosanthes TaxID=888268 RepID=A0A1E5V329_9POAL|nr:hypothetical protein BAE44_0019461 [Dichanthelium oligosanthes]
MVTTKADIYSFGVIIIEMIAGRKISPYDNVSSCVDFVQPVLENWRNRLEMAPSYTSLEIHYQQIKSCLEIGLSCIKLDPMERPAIGEIIESLTKWESSHCNVGNEEKPPADQVLSLTEGCHLLTQVIFQ